MRLSGNASFGPPRPRWRDRKRSLARSEAPPGSQWERRVSVLPEGKERLSSKMDPFWRGGGKGGREDAPPGVPGLHIPASWAAWGGKDGGCLKPLASQNSQPLGGLARDSGKCGPTHLGAPASQRKSRTRYHLGRVAAKKASSIMKYWNRNLVFFDF